MALEDLDRQYATHHAERRGEGEHVFVPERVPLFVGYVGGPGRRVLDIGCRAGAVTRHFAQGNDVVGMDVDSNALAKLPQYGVTPLHHDAEAGIPFPDASFDVVVVGEVIEHLRSPDALVAEVARVLAPGGRLVGSVPNAFRLKNRLLFLRGRRFERDPTHLHFFSPGEIVELLAPFEQVEVHFVGGRYIRLHPRLLGRDMVFAALRPA